MATERFLIDYLPPFMQEYPEMQRIMTADQVKIDDLWSAAHFIFANQYIDNATDYGLSRWEKMLNITIKPTDTIFSRRINVKTKLNNNIPYTMKALIQKMETISDGLPFSIDLQNKEYLLKLYTEWDIHGQIDSLKDMLEQIIPANLVIKSKNALPYDLNSSAVLGSVMSTTAMIDVSDAGDEFIDLSGKMTVPAFPVLCEAVPLNDAGDEHFSITGSNFVPAKSVLAEVINLTD